MANVLKTLEQIAGALLMLVVLLDVFLTVLYARMGTGILSRRVARGVWSMFRAVSQGNRSHRGRVLALCGPSILVALVLVWGFGLTLGTALILHPHLGTSIKASSGETEKDFVSALYTGGSSIAIVGAGNYEPQSPGFKMFYLFNSLVGMSVLSVTLTYLMQIYTALQKRNSLALSVDIGTERTGDAAEYVAHLGPQGHFDSGYTNLANLAESIASIKEAHHFYPVLFYFRFEEPYYSVSRFTNVALDAVTIIRTALDPNEYRWLIESGAITEIADSALLLLVSLQNTFLSGAASDTQSPSSQTREQWRLRFFNAVDRLRASNIRVSPDLQAAADAYIALRAEWNLHISNLAPSMLYSMDEIDPALPVDKRAGRELRRVA